MWLALALALFTPTRALAHARLVRSSPEDGAVLSESPREVHLWFDEAIAVRLSSARWLDANGRPAGEVSLRADPANPNLVIVTLPQASPGVYSLAWKVLSDVDSHTTQGTLVFGINQALEGVARPAEAEVASPTEAVLNTLNYLTLAVVIGALLVGGVILRQSSFNPDDQPVLASARRRAMRVGLVAAGLALVVGAGALAWRLDNLEGIGWGELLAARFGVLWLAQEGLLIILLLAVVAARRGLGWGWPSAWIAVALLALVHGLNSHAAALSTHTALAVTVSAAHLIVAGAWVGSLIVMLITLWPLLFSKQAADRNVAVVGWRQFGGLAALSVGLLAATGLYNAARQVASLDAWIVTGYGQALAGKTLAFLGVGLAGLINSASLHPRVAGVIRTLLRRPANAAASQRRALPIVLLIEAGLGLAVFGLTGWLAASPPARGPEFVARPAGEKSPASFTQPAEDLLINFAVRPNQVGPNLISIGAFNTRRPAPAETLRVMLRLTYQDQDLGTQTLIAEPEGDDRYRINTTALGVSGAWRAQVVVRRNGLEDSLAEFDWRVDPLTPSVPPRPTLISNAPLESPLTWLAVGVLIVTGIGASIFVGGQRAGTSAENWDSS
jgi:copper transport protein